MLSTASSWAWRPDAPAANLRLPSQQRNVHAVRRKHRPRRTHRRLGHRPARHRPEAPARGGQVAGQGHARVQGLAQRRQPRRRRRADAAAPEGQLALRISRQLLDDVVAHARAEAPNECCGMIASRDGVAVEVFRARNVYESPLRYEVHGDDLYRIMDEIDERDLDLGVIYHSHTRSDPVPSQTDINMAKLNGQPRFPGTLYLIVGVKGPEDDLRTWSIVGDDVTPVELEVAS